MSTPSQDEYQSERPRMARRVEPTDSSSPMDRTPPVEAMYILLFTLTRPPKEGPPYFASSMCASSVSRSSRSAAFSEVSGCSASASSLASGDCTKVSRMARTLS